MELKKIEDLGELIEQLDELSRDLPQAVLFIHHVKLAMNMHLTEYTFYRVEEPETTKNNTPPVIISVCADIYKPEYQVIFHDEHTDLVKKALNVLIDWSKTNIFFPLPVYQIPVLAEIASLNRAHITTDIKYHTLILRNIDDLPDAKTEEDICVRSLTTDAAPVIDSHLAHRDEDSEVIIRRSIDACAGFGVYCADRLVSWALLKGNGEIASVQTLPEARRRGYALAVVNKLVRHILSNGLTPFADVEVGNTVGENLFRQKLGFQEIVATSELTVCPV